MQSKVNSKKKRKEKKKNAGCIGAMFGQVPFILRNFNYNF